MSPKPTFNRSGVFQWMHRAKAALFLAAMASFLLSGCVAPVSVPVLLSLEEPPGKQESQWTAYGAYYQFDEIFVEQSFAEGGNMSHSAGSVVVNKRLKILTPEGVKFGTIEIPRYSESITEKRLAAFDSSGQPIKLDVEGMMREFKKSGKILFPNVRPGTRLDVYLKFNHPNPMTVFEHWFSGKLPVAMGRFTFSCLDRFHFDYQVYGPVKVGATAKKTAAEHLHYRTWVVSNVRPRSRLDFQEDIDAAEPRVSVVMRSYNDFPIISNWEGLADQYEKAAFKKALYLGDTKLKKKAIELTKGLTSEDGKARAIFRFVQDNISFKDSPLKTIYADRVLTSGQGNVWEMAAVLKDMFEFSGLKTEVLVTRPRSMGGFDPKFETPIQLTVPLIKVITDGRERVAFPYTRSGALGEYPEDYFGLSALSISFKDTVPLPEYSAGPSISRSTYNLDPTGPEADQSLEIELGGYLAYAFRTALFKESKTEVKEVFQKYLTGIGSSNALIRCEVSNQDSSGKPLLAKLAFRNPGQLVERKGETQLRLSHIFYGLFSSYDTSRASGFKNSLESRQVVRIEVSKIPGKRLEPTMLCTEAENELFKTTCTTDDTPVAMVFTRDVVLRKAVLSAERMRQLYPQITELNRISESRLVLREEFRAKTPPSPGKPVILRK